MKEFVDKLFGKLAWHRDDALPPSQLVAYTGRGTEFSKDAGKSAHKVLTEPRAAMGVARCELLGCERDEEVARHHGDGEERPERRKKKYVRKPLVRSMPTLAITFAGRSMSFVNGAHYLWLESGDGDKLDAFVQESARKGTTSSISAAVPRAKRKKKHTH